MPLMLHIYDMSIIIRTAIVNSALYAAHVQLIFHTYGNLMDILWIWHTNVKDKYAARRL